MGLVINWGDDIILYGGKESSLLGKGIFITGPGKKLITFGFSGQVHCLGIRFFPWAGWPFFLKPPESFLHQNIPGSKENLKGFVKIKRALSSDAVIGDQVEQLQGVMEESLFGTEISSSQIKIEKLKEIIQLTAAQPELKLQEICRRCALSLREVQRLFKAYVGVSPHSYLSLQRIHRSKKKIVQQKDSTLTAISQEAGFYDQAHFIREFKILVDETPRKYREIKKRTEE